MGEHNPTDGSASVSEVVDYLEQAAPDDVTVHAGANGIKVVWSGKNRIEVFEHLMELGWFVNSVDGYSREGKSIVWLQDMETITDWSDFEVELAGERVSPGGPLLDESMGTDTSEPELKPNYGTA